MVKIEDITEDQICLKNRSKKIKDISKNVFDNNFKITRSHMGISIREVNSSSSSILSIPLDKDQFYLTDKRYLDETKKLAEKYELAFGGEVIIKTDYSGLIDLLEH